MKMDYLDPIHSAGMPRLAEAAFALDFRLRAKNRVRNCAYAIAETAPPEARTVLRHRGSGGATSRCRASRRRSAAPGSTAPPCAAPPLG